MTKAEHEALRLKFEKWFREDYFSGMSDAGEYDPVRNIYVDFPAHMAWCGFRGHAMKVWKEQQCLAQQ